MRIEDKELEGVLSQPPSEGEATYSTSLNEQGVVQNMNTTKQPLAEGGVLAVQDAEPPTLVNRKLPFYENKQERPAHRLMLELAAKGYDVKEIAQRTGYTTVCVNNILRQPALQSTLVKDIRKTVTEDEQVVKIIRDNVVKAVNALASIIDGGDGVRASDRIAAAEALLCRRYGKPNQPINREKGVDLDSLAIAELVGDLPQTQGTTTA